jgi:hypothetical protein
MSIYEVASESSIYSYTFPAMGAGSVNNGVAIPNYLGACSQILGCVRITAGGAVGQPYADVTSGLATFPSIILRSSSATDTSVYRVYWTNKLSESSIATVLGC